MFKRLTAILLLLAFTAQSFNVFCIKLSYCINSTAYAKNCINKATPALHCNGKCQMMKKIKADEKREQESQEKKQDVKNSDLSSKSFYPSINLQIANLASNLLLYPNKIGAATDNTKNFFRPPQL